MTMWLPVLVGSLTNLIMGVAWFPWPFPTVNQKSDKHAAWPAACDLIAISFLLLMAFTESFGIWFLLETLQVGSLVRATQLGIIVWLFLLLPTNGRLNIYEEMLWKDFIYATGHLLSTTIIETAVIYYVNTSLVQ